VTPAPRCTYLLPIRRVHARPREMSALAAYFARLASAGCEVVVVDGSAPAVFDAHDQAWGGVCRHLPVDPRYRYLNGKVNGIHTGVDAAACERIIVADDDIRYTAEDVARTCRLLDEHDMVRPQNYLSPLPWWARMEAARMLINRGTLRAGDYPGTCAFRRSAFTRFGHYDGDVLFDNEEIVRHFAAAGGRIAYARDFFILKRPPTLAKWREQRPRQAYEDFGMRAKTALFAGLLPLALVIAQRRGRRAAAGYLALAALASVALARRGRSGAAASVVPASIPLWAPVWVLERCLSTYWAMYWKLRHGGYPFGDRLLTKGTGRAWSAGARAAVTRDRAA
jgi:hypothetical protein